MNLPAIAGYVIAPLHLVAGLLFILLPATPYQKGWETVYGVIALLLVTTVVVYGSILRRQRLGVGIVLLQVLAAALAAAVPFFTVDFSALWHALVYPLILGSSLLACLVVGLAVRAAGPR
jgi:hypothetical protein